MMEIAQRHQLRIVEDAAQGIMSAYKGRALGAIGDLGSLSFHETKNIMAGEGGSLLVNDPELVLRAEIIREKGTDRGRFFRGEVDKYTWQDIGSSFLPNEITAAFLWAQLEQAQRITTERLVIWQRYHEMLAPLEQRDLLRRPVVPADCRHNGHIYYILLRSHAERQKVLDGLKENRIQARVSLCPAALLARGNALRTRAWQSFPDDVAVGAPGPVADVARPERGSATAGVRGVDRDLDKLGAGPQPPRPGARSEAVRLAVLRRRTGDERRIRVGAGCPRYQSGHHGNAGNACGTFQTV